MNRSSVLLCVALAVGCGSNTPAPQPPALANSASASPATPAKAANGTQSDWRIVNVMPTWWAYWAKAQHKPRADQIALFQSDVVAKHPKLFVQTVVGRDPTKPFDLEAQISTFLDGVAPLVTTMQQLSNSIERELPTHRQSFMEAFPDFRWDGSVYFTISLDAFDGAVRNIDDKSQLLFGVDKIARLNGSDADLAPLFHHELFHILHLVTSNPFDPTKDNRMYQALWGEGLAVHVAKTLNPSATPSQLVLNDAMIEQGTRQLPQLAKEMLDNIDSQDETFYRDWFRGSGQRKDIPNRVGYFLGLRVAQLMGKTRNLQQLAQMKDPQLRNEIAAALRELAGS
jgi:hypothetical protein